MVWNLNTAALLVPLLFLLVGLTITVVTDHYVSRKHRRVMGVIIVLSFALIAQNLLEDWLAAGEPQWFLRTTLAPQVTPAKSVAPTKQGSAIL